MIALAFRELRHRGSQHTSSLLVAIITSVFATMVIELEAVLSVQSVGGQFVSHGFVRALLGILSVLFLFVAIFVACIVTANTFGIIMTGRAKHIALLRLLGATSRALRGSIAIEGIIVGFVGSAAGLILGLLIIAGTYQALVDNGTFVPVPINLGTPLLVTPVVVGILSTAGSAWFGSRKLLSASPLEAAGHAQEPSVATLRSIGARNRVAVLVMFFGGFALLLAGALIGLASPLGVLIAAPGGGISFLGFVLGANLFIPPILKRVGALTGPGVSSALASANALRYPARASRSTIGLIIGVTLVTMFTVAGQSFVAETTPVANNAGAASGSDKIFLHLTMGVLDVLIGFSLVIAAIGLVNSLSLSVLQRRREIGLLRALGFTRGQVRRMVLAESVQLTIVGGGVGLVLGVVYGWAGVLAAIASDGHIGGFFWPTIPAWIIGSIIAGALVISVVASVLPARRATRIAPMRALAAD
jgi:putative ABC transport system permease protein